MIPRHGLLGGSRPVAAEPLQSLARALPTFTTCTCAMRLRCAPLTYELLWRVAQTLLTRADLLSRMQVRGVITFLLQEGPQEGRVRRWQHATGDRWMEPCACADIAHRFAGERRCRRRTVAEMGGVGGRGRGGRVGAEERPEGVVPKGSWGTGAGRAATQSSVRPRAVALHITWLAH